MDWILHADDSVVAVNKPAGLLSVPGRGPDKQDCAFTRIRASCPDAEIVHRLDQATSGLLVFARGPHAHRHLNAAFSSRQVVKRYVAVVRGLPDDDEGCIDLPLAADWPNRPRQRVDTARGKPSRTHWRVLAREASLGESRLELVPHTGRSHQLRVHLMSRGWPIVGDALYGDDDLQRRAARLLLHASALTLPHPATGHGLHLECPAPF